MTGDTIYVLLDGDAVEADALVNLMRDGMLEQDAADARIVVQVIDGGEELRCRGFLGKGDAERFHADTAAGIALHAHVSGGGRVGANKDGGENRRVGSGFFS